MEHYCYDFYGASGNLTNTMILEEFTGRLVWRLRGSSEAGQLSSVIDCMDAVNPKMVGVSSVVLGRNMHLTIHTFSEVKAVFVDYFGDLCPSERALLTRMLEEFFAPSMTHFGTIEMFKARVVSPLGAFGQHVCYGRAAMDLPTARGLVNDIVAQIKMTPLGASLELVNYPHFDEYDLLQPIAESHIAVHTHAGKSLIDVFSCKPFSAEAVSELVGCTPVAETIRGLGIPPMLL